MKNTHHRSVRKRTVRRDRPETQDRRVQRTRTSLHDALIGLAHEKPYPSIAVKEILDRANVGRSTFYTHFRDKDDLLQHGIADLLQSVPRSPSAGQSLEGIVAFALPLLQRIAAHRHPAGATMRRDGRIAMHAHLRRALTAAIAEELARVPPRRESVPRIPSSLLATHVAATFVLVLNWWVEHDSPWTAADVDGLFRALVMPTLDRR